MSECLVWVLSLGAWAGCLSGCLVWVLGLGASLGAWSGCLSGCLVWVLGLGACSECLVQVLDLALGRALARVLGLGVPISGEKGGQMAWCSQPCGQVIMHAVCTAISLAVLAVGSQAGRHPPTDGIIYRRQRPQQAITSSHVAKLFSASPLEGATRIWMIRGLVCFARNPQTPLPPSLSLPPLPSCVVCIKSV